MKIALYAYGSIINNQTSVNYDGSSVRVSQAFKKAKVGDDPVTIPLSFSRISSQGKNNERITLVPDTGIRGKETPLFFAPMIETSLTQALQEVKAREGTENNKFVSYVRKGRPQGTTTGYHVVHVNGEDWSYRANGIAEEKIKDMVKHLKQNHLDAGIITTFDKKGGGREELRTYLSTRPGTKTRTKLYFDDLPRAVKAIHRPELKTLGIIQ